MPDEIKDQEPKEEESAPLQEERAPEQAAEPEVELEPKEPTDKKALREARRDATKAERRYKKLQKELEEVKRRTAYSQAAGPDEVLKMKAAEYDRLRTEMFIEETLEEAGLERDDKRIDRDSMEGFMYSVGVAQREDAEERLAKKEKQLESLEEKLHAKAEAKIEEMKRDLRRELGLDKVPSQLTQAGEGGETEQAIRQKHEARLAELRKSGRKGPDAIVEARQIKNEMAAEIAEARQQ